MASVPAAKPFGICSMRAVEFGDNALLIPLQLRSGAITVTLCSFDKYSKNYLFLLRLHHRHLYTNNMFIYYLPSYSLAVQGFTLNTQV
jgi:hypothetical protein